MGIVTPKGGYNTICRVCGFQYKNFEMFRRWDSLWPVCKDCIEPRHPMDLYRVKPEDQRVIEVSSDVLPNYSLLGRSFTPGTITVDTGVATTIGNRFQTLANATVYMVNIWMGETGASGNWESIAPIYYTVGIYENAGQTLLWSKQVTGLRPGRWNGVQVTPNLALATSLNFTVALWRPDDAPISQQTEPTIANTTLFDYTAAYSATGSSITYPSSASTSVLYLIDVLARPT